MELMELGTGVAVQANRRYLRSLYRFHFFVSDSASPPVPEMSIRYFFEAFYHPKCPGDQYFCAPIA